MPIEENVNNVPRTLCRGPFNSVYFGFGRRSSGGTTEWIRESFKERFNLCGVRTKPYRNNNWTSTIEIAPRNCVARETCFNLDSQKPRPRSGPDNAQIKINGRNHENGYYRAVRRIETVRRTAALSCDGERGIVPRIEKCGNYFKIGGEKKLLTRFKSVAKRIPRTRTPAWKACSQCTWNGLNFVTYAWIE